MKGAVDVLAADKRKGIDMAEKGLYIQNTDDLEICMLKGKQVLNTRSLWEEIFQEDSREFVEYYYQHKAEKNTSFALKSGQELIAMVHLTPYQAVFKGKQNRKRAVSYIVGVATKEEYRHKGCMKKLLQEALKELHKRKEPFAFLMPASPEIYAPFSFTYIYERENYSLNPKYLKAETLKKLAEGNWKEYSFPMKRDAASRNDGGLYDREIYTLRLAAPGSEERLADFAKKVLKEQYDLYMEHTEQYYEILQREIKSQKGSLFFVERQGKLLATAVFALDGKVPFLQELLFEDGEGKQVVEQLFLKKLQKKPVIMARVIRIEEMLSLLYSQTDKELLLTVADNDIVENQGSFLWQIGKDYSRVTRLEMSQEVMEESQEQHKRILQVTIEELTAQIFTGTCKNTALEKAWDGIFVYRNSLINEIV